MDRVFSISSTKMVQEFKRMKQVKEKAKHKKSRKGSTPRGKTAKKQRVEEEGIGDMGDRGVDVVPLDAERADDSEDEERDLSLLNLPFYLPQVRQLALKTRPMQLMKT